MNRLERARALFLAAVSGSGRAWDLRILGKTVDAAPLTTPYVGDTAQGERGSLVVVELDGSFDADGAKIDFAAQGAPAWGQQYVRDAAGQTRVRGLMGAGRIIVDDVIKNSLVGLWNTAFMDATNIQGIRTINDVLNIQGTMAPSIGAVSTGIALLDGDQIDWIVVARATGSYVLASINGGNWQLQWWFDNDSAATLYAGFSNFDADGSVNLIGATVLSESFVPDPVVSDGYGLIPIIRDSGSNELNATPVRVGLNGSASYFDGAGNSYVDVYSANYNTQFDGDEGASLVVAQAANGDMWNDGVVRAIFATTGVDVNTDAVFIQTFGSGQLSFLREANSVSQSVTKAGMTETGDFFGALSWSKTDDKMRAFYGDTGTVTAQEGSDQPGLDNFVGPLRSDGSVIGALINDGTQPWSGNIKHRIDFLGHTPEISEINALGDKLLAGTATTADLDAIHSNWAWWRLDEQYATDGLAHLEADGHGSGKTRDGRTWSSEGNKRYNGAVGEEDLVVNGDFSAWTGVAPDGDTPDNWTVVDTQTPTHYVTDASPGATWLGAAGLMRIKQTILTVGGFFKTTVVITAVSGGGLIVHDASNGFIKNYVTTGTKIMTGRAANINYEIYTNGVATATVTSAVVVSLPIADLLDLTNTGKAEHYAATNATIATDTQGGVCVAANSTKANGIPVYYDRVFDEVVAEKWIAGVFDSEIMRVSKTYNAAATLKASVSDIDVDGTYNLTVWYDDEFVATVPYSDVELVGNTYAGEFGFLEGGFAETEIIMKSNEGPLYDPFFVGVT